MYTRFIHKMPGYLTVALLLATLLVFNGGSWALLQLVRESKEHDLGQRLLAVGTTTRVLLANESIDLPDASIIARFQEYPTYRYLLALMRSLRVANSLLNVVLLDKQGNVLIDARQQLPPGILHPLLALDEVEFQQAVANTSAVTPYYTLQQMPYKRAYIPITAPDGTVLYVLRLEASRDYFEAVNILRRHVYLIDGIGSLLLIVIALILYRLLRRLVRAEETIAQTERLQALGTMAATVAHEIRNPLGIIRASAEEVKSEMQDSESTIMHSLNDIIAECDRINNEISNFLQWGSGTVIINRGHRGSPLISLREIIEDVKPGLTRVAERKNIALEVSTPNDALTTRIEPVAFRQALLNLVMNAIEATPEHGIVRLMVSQYQNDPEFIEIAVTDTGKGMTRAESRRAFEPFYTTKQHGAGLGLSIARRIVEQAGGSMTLNSQPGKGTHVAILLPFTSSEEEHA